MTDPIFSEQLAWAEANLGSRPTGQRLRAWKTVIFDAAEMSMQHDVPLCQIKIQVDSNEIAMFGYGARRAGNTPGTRYKRWLVVA